MKVKRIESPVIGQSGQRDEVAKQMAEWTRQRAANGLGDAETRTALNGLVSQFPASNADVEHSASRDVGGTAMNEGGLHLKLMMFLLENKDATGAEMLEHFLGRKSGETE